MKRELKTRPIYECRCDERLKTKVEKSTRLAYTELLGELEQLTIEMKLIDEICVLEVIGTPSIFKLIRKAAALSRVLPTFVFSCAENAARRKWNWSRSVCTS